MKPARPLSAAIYARISRDKEGAGLGVERQEADCRELAERLGWEVVAVYADNDISAYSGAPRPQYELMLDAIRSGQVEGVLAWHTDRLHRRPTELEKFISLAEDRNLEVQTVKSGDLNLSTASGRMVARMLGAAARGEVDHARERMKSAKSQMARDDKYRGGPRPYGFEKDGVTIRENEAAEIREAAKALLAGRSLAGVASDLNKRGLKTSVGREWKYNGLKEMLLRPRNAGLLAHGLPGRLLQDRSANAKKDDRVPVQIVGPGIWEAILDEDEWRTLVNVLTDPSRRKQDGNDPVWLGSGIYICGICGGTLRPAPYGGTTGSTRERKYLYRCVQSTHLTISTKETDAYVREVVAELVRDPRIVAALHPVNDFLAPDRERRSMLTARLATFDDNYANQRITAALWQKSTAKVNAEIEEVDARMSKGISRSASSAVLQAEDPGAAFLAAPIDIQRAVLATVLKVEVISARTAGIPIGGAWSAKRLRLTPVG